MNKESKFYRVVSDPTRIVQYIAEYTNGWFTSGGLYKPSELEEVKEYVIGVTYCSEAAVMLPFDIYKYDVLDDRNKRQHVSEIRFEQSPAYIMEDGSTSYEIVV